MSMENRLLLRGRCPRCAERVSPKLLLQEGDCPHCGSALRGPADLRAQIAGRQLSLRLAGYGLIAVASFMTGWIPLVQSGVHLLALVILHVLVIHRSLGWLTRKRRSLTRLTLKIYGALIAIAGFLLNLALAPFVGVAPFVLAFLGPAMTAAYVEVSIWLVRRRLDRQAEGRPIAVGEWALPVVLLLALVGASLALVATIYTILSFVASLETPGAAEILGFMTERTP